VSTYDFQPVIRRLEELEWTQARFERHIDVSPGMVTHWKKGTRVPNEENRLKLDAFLGAPPKIMALLVCRSPWMDVYRGVTDDDPDPDLSKGECWNFLEMPDGCCYGYAEITRFGNLAINKLGARDQDTKIDGVLVVFAATNPDDNRFVVVGWYTNATVYRETFRIGDLGFCRPGRDGDVVNSWVRFKTNDATLISADDRCFQMPRANDPQPNGGFGGIGNAGVWYGLNDQALNDRKMSPEARQSGIQFRTELTEYIEKHNDPDVGSAGEGTRTRVTHCGWRREAAFRNRILQADNKKCTLTSETTPEVLDAAHIVPVADDGGDAPCNGITLRTDLHRLFDARPRLFTFDTCGRVVDVAEQLSPYYRDLLQDKRLPDTTLERVRETLCNLKGECDGA